MIRVLLGAAFLCFFFIELQINQDPLSLPTNEAQQLVGLETDTLDFSKAAIDSDLIFYQSVPTSHFNSAFIFIFQSIVESLRRQNEVHYLFYQNISYSKWRELLRHCFLRAYTLENDEGKKTKFVFGAPYKVYAKLQELLIFPESFEPGLWHQVSCPEEIFDGHLWVTKAHEFVFLTNDSGAKIPEALKSSSRTKTFLEFSSELIPYLEQIYPSKRRRKGLPKLSSGGKFQVVGNKLMISNELPSELTSSSWFKALKLSQFTQIWGGSNLNGRLSITELLNDQAIQTKLEEFKDEKFSKFKDILKTFKGSMSFGFGTPEDLNGNWYLKIDFKKVGHTAQALSVLREHMERNRIKLSKDQMKQNYVINLPFFSKDIYILRRGASLILSSAPKVTELEFSGEIRKSFFAVVLNFQLYKDWLKDRWFQLARHYHIRSLKRCTKRRQNQKSVCPLGSTFEKKVCPVHGPMDNPSITKALQDDKRFEIFQDFLDSYANVTFTLSARENKLEFDVESN